MAICIVDASVVIEYLVTGTYTPNALALFNQATPNDRFIVPEFCLLECTNVLWKQVRFNGMPVSRAEALLRHLKKLPLTRVPAKAALSNALTIGLTHQLAIYDAAYVALAKRSGYPLISLDQPQIQAATAEGVSLIPITQLKL
ncbi:MAG: type II toxin-antitoxin system VapC family toxin [Anaerolineae bacterium]|jgi:predicted nucleic acid-binding protein|nr:type II toxin-antitoxin system VapC family toxin [Anaerolineae bacterium]